MQGVTPQNRHVASLTHEFLNVHWDREKPLLLGISGGSDSKALLYALLECGVTPHLAHVDHGWREESKEEAEQLKQEADRLKCPFYAVRLNLEGRSEDEARTARFTFFQSLGYDTVLLAHHADDLAETVLKRILEGAHLPFLSGMQPVSEQYGMSIWRPFLKIRKSQIREYLEENGIRFFEDATNLDPAYLRARMRLEIFPFLNRVFGKETVENLAILSERASELKAYLDQQTLKAPIQKGPWGTLADLNGLERIEQRHLIQKISRSDQTPLSREVIETILDWVKMGKKSKEIRVRNKKILVDTGRVFFIS